MSLNGFFCKLGLLTAVLAAAPLWAQDAIFVTCPTSATANGGTVKVDANGTHVTCAVTVNFGSDQADTFSFGFQVAPNTNSVGTAPTPTRNIILVDTTLCAVQQGGNCGSDNGASQAVAVAPTWGGISPAQTGNSVVADLTFTIPPGALAGESYTASLTGGNWSFNSGVGQNFAVTGTSQIVTLPTVLSITAPTTGTALTSLTAGTAFTQAITATGGLLSYTYSLTGPWPAGFSISNTGVITGTPGAAANLNGLGVTVTDSTTPTKETASATYTLLVNAALSNIAPISLPSGSQGAQYTSGNISVTGGTAPYTWSTTLTLGTYGLALGTGPTSTTTITGTPNQPLNGLTIPVKVTDADGAIQTANLTLVVSGPLALAPATSTSLPTGTVGYLYTTVVAGQNVIVASGGTPGALGYSFSATSLPGGLSIAPTTGIISGSPTANGTFSNVQVTVADHATPNPGSVINTYTIVINQAITLTAPNSLPGGTTGAAYPPAASNVSFSATGGSGSYKWSISGLAGVNITATGSPATLSGSPTTAGSASVTVTVTDANFSYVTVSKPYTVPIALGPSITSPATLPGATINTPYTVTVSGSGGTGPFNWTTNVAFPAGLAFANLTTNTLSNTITGTPTATGSTTPLIVTVTDANQASASSPSYTLTVYAVPVIAGTSLPIATIGSAYTSGSSVTLTAGGAPPVTFTAAPLPGGLTINSSGVIAGTPAANAASSYNVLVQAKDGNQVPSNQLTLTLTVHPALQIVPATLPLGIPSVQYTTTTLTPSGGSGSGYQFTWAGFPPGLSLSSAGVITGTPTTSAGSPYNVGITLKDGIGAQVTIPYTIVIAPPLSITGPASLPAGVVTVNYAGPTITATGGSGIYSWSAQGLPPGLTIVAGTGTIIGAPTAVAGSPYSVVVTVTDTYKTTATKTYSLSVAALPLSIPGVTMPNGAVNVPYPYTILKAQGGIPPYSYTWTGLPPGLTTDGNGDVSGTPTTSTGSPFTVTESVSDSGSSSMTRVYTVVISGSLTVVGPSTLPAATLNTPYTGATVTSAGGIGPYTYTATGLPAGLTIGITTGIISGTPTSAAGNPVSVTVTVEDSTGKTATMNYSLVVTSSPLTISGPASLPSGTISAAYTSTTIAASGGTGVYTFSATGLPTGLAINSSTGAISGTPAASSAGPYTVVVTVTDSSSATATKSYSLTINPPAASLPTITSITTSAGGELPVAPNTWVTIMGNNFTAAGFTDTWNNAIKNSTTGALPTVLDGLSVMVGTTPAYVNYISATQINLLMPNIGFGQMQITVMNSVGTSAPYTVTSQLAVPGFFAWPNAAGLSPGDSTQQPVATHLADYSYAVANGTFPGTTTVPAKPGEMIVLWGSGFGPTTPANPFGVAIPSTPIFATSNNVTVTLNGAPVTVSQNLATLTASSAGLYQVTITIPASLANGTYPITTSVNGVTSPPLTLTVHN